MGCTLLSTEYINNRSLLKYICSCGETNEKTYNCFQYKNGVGSHVEIIKLSEIVSQEMVKIAGDRVTDPPPEYIESSCSFTYITIRKRKNKANGNTTPNSNKTSRNTDANKTR